MKIVADDRIPFLRGVFEPFARVTYLPGKQISPADIVDADALIVRTRTRCDRALLQGSAVRFVATATIGFDHISVNDLQDLGIEWSNAPGCNAVSVKNYIASALAAMDMPLAGKTMGIVGVGHVGSRVAKAAEAFGMNVLLNDPPRAEKEGTAGFVPLDEVLAKSDIVTLHVPLESGGKYPTVNLADREFFRKMRSGAWFFNSCRGEAVDRNAFLCAAAAGKLGGALMDVWPGEPDMGQELIDAVRFGTPHIAGYSADGKANGTSAAVRYIAGKLGISELLNWKAAGIPDSVFSKDIDLAGVTSVDAALRSAVLHAYDIRRDAEALRNDPGAFEALRGSYWVRREFSAYTVHNAPAQAEKALRMLDFNIG
ncbi:MAG: 4-phosphoerythronate dehydrogenase [Lentisphaerae bacterium]|nr:4-phosphoerythronate dehydrogenase [Lentisphaerota bacterium]